MVGTAAYMAPEQAEGLQAGAPADLYSLALVTYEALTGVNPVRTGTAAQRARRLGAHLPPLRRQRRDLRRELGRAIDLALRPRPRERGSLEELRAALVDALAERGRTRPGSSTSPWRPHHARTAATGDPRDRRRALGRTPPSRQPLRGRDAAEDDDHGAAAVAGMARARARRRRDRARWPGWLARARARSAAGRTGRGRAGRATVLVAALPRIGWLVTARALVVAAAQQRPGGALVIVARRAVVPDRPAAAAGARRGRLAGGAPGAWR